VLRVTAVATTWFASFLIMSRTYSIGCRQCRKHLWIAQASLDRTSLYTGEPHIMDALKKFLFEHMKHPLVFDENCELEIGEWEEIETRPPDGANDRDQT
jgi:hypothetical protein